MFFYRLNIPWKVVCGFIPLTLSQRGLRATRSGVVTWKLAEEYLHEEPKVECFEKPETPTQPRPTKPEKKVDYKAESERKAKEKYIARKLAKITSENQYKLLEDIVTPLSKVPYGKQLLIKYNQNKKILQTIYSEMKEAGVDIIYDPRKLPCPLETVYASPVTEEYRNKDEFCIYTGVDGNPKTVGFFIGSPASSVVCVNPYTLINTKSSHKQVVKAFQNYIRESPLPVCKNFQDRGHWRNIVVRSNRHGHVMAIVIMHPQNMIKEELDVEKEKLKEFFLVGEGHNCNLRSLYFQACCHARCSQQVAPFELLFGDTHIVEELNDIQYHISPGSFFQINTSAAAVLLKIVKGLCDPQQNMTVFDICCGTGTSSLQLAPLVKNVIGVDSQPEAVEDANLNAEINGIDNAKFIHGRAELVIPEVLPNVCADDLVAILNPGRGGLNFPVIRALRQCKHLKKVIYITCKADGVAKNNFIQLCRPATGENSRILGLPFRPVIAVPVDLFPHTNHCELVIMFER